LAHALSYLQCTYHSITKQEQINIADEIIYDASMLQDKIFLNLIRLPFLVRVVPIISGIKFDVVKTNKIENNNTSTSEKIFLYNPWEKDESINYYWTVNSFQKVILHLYNPLQVELKVYKIVILFEGNKPFSIPSI
jgi:hypothetical protein